MLWNASIESMSSDGFHHPEKTPRRKKPSSMRSFDDDTLMLRAQNGDKEAFEVIISRHMDFVIASASTFFADPGFGTFAAQDVFFELWKTRLTYKPEGKFKIYLTNLLVSVCKNSSRGKPGSPLAQTSFNQSSQPVHKALKEFDTSDREILVLRYGLDMAYDEISGMTGKPPKTLRSRVFESLRRLRKTLEGES